VALAAGLSAAVSEAYSRVYAWLGARLDDAATDQSSLEAGVNDQISSAREYLQRIFVTATRIISANGEHSEIIGARERASFWLTGDDNA
jgi:hypothetical protein